jgi:hypothetical protein
LTHGADHSTVRIFETLRWQQGDSFDQRYEDLSNLSVFRDRCEDVTPRLCIELGLVDRHENVANRFRARAHAINWPAPERDACDLSSGPAHRRPLASLLLDGKPVPVPIAFALGAGIGLGSVLRAGLETFMDYPYQTPSSLPSSVHAQGIVMKTPRLNPGRVGDYTRTTSSPTFHSPPPGNSITGPSPRCAGSG